MSALRLFSVLSLDWGTSIISQEAQELPVWKEVAFKLLEGQFQPGAVKKEAWLCGFTSLEAVHFNSSGSGATGRLPDLPRGLGAALNVTITPPPALRPQPAGATAFDVIIARHPSLRCLISARRPRWKPTARSLAVLVAAPSNHVPSRPFSADPGSRVPKGPPGRTRARLHAPDGQQEGSAPGVCSQLPSALLTGGPA